MKTMAITFLLTFILSSPLHAHMNPAADHVAAGIAQTITPLNLSNDLDTDQGSSNVDKSVVVILGDAGEVYFFFMNQLFSLRQNDEAVAPCSTPLQKSFN